MELRLVKYKSNQPYFLLTRGVMVAHKILVLVVGVRIPPGQRIKSGSLEAIEVNFGDQD